MVNPLKAIASALQRPQSVAWGTLGALDPFFEPGANGIGATSRGDMFSQGLRGNVSPADFTADDLTGKIQGTALNIVADPLLIAGGVAKGATAGTKLGSLLEGATTVGKLGEDATRGQKLAQAARYALNGATGSGGDAGTALATALGMPVVERGVGKAATVLGGRLASRGAEKAIEDIVGQGTEKAVSRTGLQAVEDEYTRAAKFIEDEARRLKLDQEYTAGMAQAARDAMGNVGIEQRTGHGLREAARLSQMERPVVSQSAQGALMNDYVNSQGFSPENLARTMRPRELEAGLQEGVGVVNGPSSTLRPKVSVGRDSDVMDQLRAALQGGPTPSEIRPRPTVPVAGNNEALDLLRRALRQNNQPAQKALPRGLNEELVNALLMAANG